MKKIFTATAIAAGATYLARRHQYVQNNVAEDLRDVTAYLPTEIPPALLSKIPASQAVIMPTRELAEGVTKRRVSGHSPETTHDSFEAYLLKPAKRSELDGAVLWIHGGGHVIGTAGIDLDVSSALAARLGVPVLSVDYKQAGAGGQFPGDFNECYAALRWLQTHAEELGCNSSNIAVAGNSAGGGLAAGVVQKASDTGNKVAFQALIYPMLDHQTALKEKSEHAGRGTTVWTHSLNKGAWGTYLCDVNRKNLPPYASPAQYEHPEKLPATWIGVGDIDLFYAEDKAYAEKLSSAGVPTEFYIAEGMYHGADLLNQTKPTTKAFTTAYTEAIREGLRKA